MFSGYASADFKQRLTHLLGAWAFCLLLMSDRSTIEPIGKSLSFCFQYGKLQSSVGFDECFQNAWLRLPFGTIFRCIFFRASK